MEEYRNIWVIAIYEDAEPDISTLKLVGYARLLGDNVGSWVEAVLIGKNLDENHGKELIMYGADNAYVISSENIDIYNVEQIAKIIEKLANEKKPEFILFPDNKFTRAIAGYISGKFKSALLTECIKLDIDPYERKLRAHKPAFEGQLLAVVEATGGFPQVATIKIATYSLPMKDEFRSGRVYPVEINLDELGVKTKVIEKGKAEKVEPHNWKAKVVIAVGEKIGSKENYEKIKQAANRLEIFVGGTKKAVDEKIVPEEDLIGPLGKIIRPDLLVTIGTSELPDYLFGVEKKSHLLTIVEDSTEPLAKMARYYAVSKPEDILDLLIKEMEEVDK